MEDGFLCFGAAMMVSYCAAWLVDLALIGYQAAADEEAARFKDDVAGELRRRGGVGEDECEVEMAIAKQMAILNQVLDWLIMYAYMERQLRYVSHCIRSD